MLYWLFWPVSVLVFSFLCGFRTRGRRHVPRTGGVILAVNHASVLDPVIVGTALTRAVHFMARETLFVGPFGLFIRVLNAFPVARGGADHGAMREFLRRVEEGKVVLLFPEGTRTRDGRLGRVMPGVGALALRAAAPVVPTYITGTFEAWPRGRLLPRLAPVGVRFGPAVTPEDLGEGTKRERQARLVAEIESRLRALEARAAEG